MSFLRHLIAADVRWLTSGLNTSMLALAVFLTGLPAAHAQRSPNIGYVYPAGGRQGSTFEAAISGQYLDGVTNVSISGEGVQATLVEYVKPLNGKQLILLRDRLKNMRQGMSGARKGDQMIRVRSETDTNEVLNLSRSAVQSEIAEINKKLSNPKNRRPPNPQLAEDVKLTISVAADAEPGDRELRLLTAAGFSNPVVFRVGQLPEFSKKAEVSLSGPRSANPLTFANRARVVAAPEMRITLPAVVNGQIMPGGVDRFRFSARAGQRLVAAASARELIPYIADAVPGWFQATLALYDAQGKELAYDDDYLFNPDPVITCKIPADGEYTIEIKDAIYRGREDFVYRITMGELPFITAIFPLGGQAGGPTTVELQGWNLPTNSLTMVARSKEPGVYPLSVRQEERVSNRVPFAVGSLPECREGEPNDSPASAQPITLPIMVNGRIDRPDDRDVFRFEGNAGDEIVAEVLARRLGSPLDSVLKLTDSTGRQLSFNDDQEDPSAGLITHHADSRISLALPAQGTYYLHVGDTQCRGGAGYGYRLRVSLPHPDFELRVTPSSVNVRAGFSVPLTVHALRKDGFTNDITVVLRNAPAGYDLIGGRVPGHTNQARVTLKAPPRARNEPVSLFLEGRATIGGQVVVHQAVPAEDRMQAFAYRHLVPSHELKVAILQRGQFRAPARMPNKKTATSPPSLQPKSK